MLCYLARHHARELLPGYNHPSLLVLLWIEAVDNGCSLGRSGKGNALVSAAFPVPDYVQAGSGRERGDATPKFLMYKSMSDRSDPIGKREGGGRKEKQEGWTSASIGFRLDARHFNQLSLRYLPLSLNVH